MWNVVESGDRKAELAKLRETLTEVLRKGFASWIEDDRSGAEATFRDLAETFDVLSSAAVAFAETNQPDRN